MANAATVIIIDSNLKTRGLSQHQLRINNLPPASPSCLLHRLAGVPASRDRSLNNTRKINQCTMEPPRMQDEEILRSTEIIQRATQATPGPILTIALATRAVTIQTTAACS